MTRTYVVCANVIFVHLNRRNYPQVNQYASYKQSQIYEGATKQTHARTLTLPSPTVNELTVT